MKNERNFMVGLGAAIVFVAIALAVMIAAGVADADTFLTIDDEADLTNAIEFIHRMNEAFGDTYSQPIVRIYTNKPCAVITNEWSRLCEDEYWQGWQDGGVYVISNAWDKCGTITNWAFTNYVVTVTNACTRQHWPEPGRSTPLPYYPMPSVPWPTNAMQYWYTVTTQCQNVVGPGDQIYVTYKDKDGNWIRKRLYPEIVTNAVEVEK